ncbi:hypothetical protein M5K25_006666 [Dendrobium thyrsiflorum]|uniref:Uncharacterized protein n=1 Tax=Dendrobium thyrsiflorum TaxID=117978 RepID=A0ABD0VIY6_DENTH
MALTISCSSKASHIPGSQRIVAWKEIHSSSRIVRSNDSHRSCERAYHWSMAYHLQPHSPDNHPPRAGVGEKQKFLSQSDNLGFAGQSSLPSYYANGGGMDDRPDQDLIVPSSRVIVVPGFDVIGEHTGAGHNHNIVMPFGSKSPCSEGPES